MGLKYFLFAKGTATVINRPLILLNNEPKNAEDWISLDIWALDNFISVDILFWTAFLNFVFCLVVNNNWCGKLFPLKARNNKALIKPW